MSYSEQKFKSLTKKFGEYGSWAIWDDQNLLLERLNPKKLHTNYVIIGLNISRPLFSRWANFRGGMHDKKLELIFNKTPYRGCYMTDLVKCIGKDSQKIVSKLRKDINYFEQHKASFQNEMIEIGVNRKTKFILLGSAVQFWFQSFINPKFQKNGIYRIEHYSYRFGSFESWVEKSSEILNSKPVFQK